MTDINNGAAILRAGARRWCAPCAVIIVALLAAPRGAADDDTADARVTVVFAPRQEAVLAAQVPGRVTHIARELGQAFARGDELVRLDDLVYRVNRETAAARLAWADSELARVEKLAADKTRRRHAEAVLAAARAKLTATQSLYDDGHASHVDLEDAKRDVATAQAELELAEAATVKESAEARRERAVAQGRLAIAEDELGGCVVAAPYAGRVSRVLTHNHEWVERGKPLIEIVDDRVLRAKLLLPSRLFRAVQLKQTLTLHVTETGQSVPATVSHIAAVLDPASTTFEVYAEVDNQDGQLRAGMNGWLHLSALKVP
jgi:multidrug resistance efflux pump